MTELRALLAIHPLHGEALQNLGILLIQQQRVGESVEVFERLTQVEEDPVAQLEAHLRLATIEAERGREEVALNHYRAALALDETSLEAHLGLAAALGRQGQFAAAAAEYGRVLALDPGRQDAYFGRVTSLILGEQYREAVTALEEVMALPAAPLAFQHVLAQLLAGCPDPEVRDGERALTLAQEVFEREQTLDHAETVAMALAESGRFEEAVDLQGRVVAEADRAGLVRCRGSGPGSTRQVSTGGACQGPVARRMKNRAPSGLLLLWALLASAPLASELAFRSSATDWGLDFRHHHGASGETIHGGDHGGRSRRVRLRWGR